MLVEYSHCQVLLTCSILLGTDAHVRIGGALGTGLKPDECPPVRNGINENCSAASLMMHITKEASAYLENVWLWVADHLIE